MPGWGKETSHSFSVTRFFISLSGTRKWSCAKSHAGVWVTCRFSLYCHSGISKKKTKRTKIPPTTTKYASVSISFIWLLYSFSSQMGCSQTFKKNAKAPQQIRFTLLPTRTGQAGTHWGSLSVAIVQVLWRKHGVSASHRLAGISRWLNVRWSEAEWKNSLSGFISQIQAIVKYSPSMWVSRTCRNCQRPLCFLPYSWLEIKEENSVLANPGMRARRQVPSNLQFINNPFASIYNRDSVTAQLFHRCWITGMGSMW